MMFGAGVVVVVYILFFLLSFKSAKDSESMSVYECGFDISTIVRMMFSYRFFLIAILFLIFDVEIALMLPIPFLIGGFFYFYFFLLILLLGLVYEYYCGALEWM